MERANFTSRSKMVDELGGPGSSIGYGVTAEQALMIAQVRQLKRIADALESLTPTRGGDTA